MIRNSVGKEWSGHMKINVQQCSEQIQLLLAELKKQIGMEFAADGLVLCAQKQEKRGFAIEKKEKELRICYGSLPDFCRAILTAESRSEKTYFMEGKPNSSHFGFMLDCSRNAVLRPEQLKKYIRILALMGYTYIGLYMEDTIAVKEEPYVGYMRGALTIAELKEVDAYAASFGMEVRPYIQTLAHLNQITNYCEYEQMIDCNDILLAGEERTYLFLEHLINAVAEGLSSRRINIGMDEAHMVGLGKYLDQHGYTERFAIMEKHLERVLTITEKYGYEVEMWSDMFFRLACHGEYYVEDNDMEVDICLPEHVKLVYWDYYALDTEHYDNMFKQHKKLTKNIGFAGGVWKWHGMAPHNRFSMLTGRAAVTSCIRNGIDDIVMTGWGDDGAEASAFSVLPALYAGAEYIWAKEAEEDAQEFEKNKFEVLTGISFEDYMKLDISNMLPEDGKYASNSGKYLLYNDPFIGTFDSLLCEDTAAYYRQAAERLAVCVENKEFGYIFETQTALCQVLELKAELGKKLRLAYKTGDKAALEVLASDTMPELCRRMERLYTAMETQWLTENKSFGFEVLCIRIGGLRQRLAYTAKMIERYLAGEIAQIEELEMDYLPYAYSKAYEEEANTRTLAYNLWRNMVSPSRLAW